MSIDEKENIYKKNKKTAAVDANGKKIQNIPTSLNFKLQCKYISQNKICMFCEEVHEN